MVKKRLPNGDGTMPRQLPDGRWRIDMTISDDGDNKSRKSLYGKTQEEVIGKRDKVKEELKNGCLSTSKVDKLTLGEWLVEWLETYKKGKISNNTYSSYSSCINLWIGDNLKKITLKKIRHSTLQKAINLLNSGTSNLVRVVLHQSLKVAVKNKYLLTNPADGLETVHKIKEKVIPLTKNELNLLLENRRNKKNFLYYVLSVYSGARIGELLGLSWDDIDLKQNIIHIRHNLNYNSIIKEWELGLTKTGKHRNIPIVPQIIEHIKHHKIEQSKIKLKIGNSYNEANMVFCNNNGGFINQAVLRDSLKKIVESVGITKKVSPHTLRHTFVSQMISAGVNIKLISEIVGHANINITLDTYGHLMPGDAAKAMDALARQMQDIAI